MDPLTSLISRHSHHIQNLSTLLRYATAIAIWSSAHLPNAARTSSNVIIHVVIPVLLDPRFLFLLSNLIIVSLLFLSRPSPSPSSILPKPHLHPVQFLEDEEDSPQPARQVKEKEVFKVIPEPLEEKKTKKKHVQGTLRRARSLTTTVVVRMRMATELRRAQTNLKMEKERDEKKFRDVVEAFIHKQRKFSEEENNHVYC